MEFHKMHGLGNDFIVIDARHQDIDLAACNWQQLADRHSGIGCDQVLILGNDSDSSITASYLVKNADGSPAEQCGNGIRCLAMYLKNRGEVNSQEFLLSGVAGDVRVQCLDDDTYRVNMGEPCFTPAEIPIQAVAEQGIYSIPVKDGNIRLGAVSIGNPHAIIIEYPGFDVRLGREISQHTVFPEGCNAGFVQVVGRSHIELRVYERGTGPTRACGSGACAAVAVLRSMDRVDERVNVDQPGGRLVIEWRGIGNDLWMSGPAAYVFKGQTDL